MDNKLWSRRKFLKMSGAAVIGLTATNSLGGRLLARATGQIGAESDEGFQIVTGNMAKSAIVMATNPSDAAQRGAELLSETLFRVSGAKIPVISERDVTIEPAGNGIRPTANYSSYVIVGQSDLAMSLGFDPGHLGSGGILMRTKGNTLALLGRDDEMPLDPNGTFYSVTAFLEQVIGVRYLWPGKDGEYIPALDDISIPPMDVTYTPPIRQRRIRYGTLGRALNRNDRTLSDNRRSAAQTLGFRTDMEELGQIRYDRVLLPTKDWYERLRMGGWLHQGSIGGHAFLHLWDKYGKDHPEWFAMNHAGSRDQSYRPDRARLCKSNPELIKAIAAEKIEQLNRNPNSAVSLSPNDGGGLPWCVCDNCRALDAPEGRKIMFSDSSRREGRQFEWVSLTDRMVYFWNAIIDEVTKVHPNATFVVDAYSVYKDPPIRRSLRPNVVVRTVVIDYGSEKSRQLGLEQWDGWNDANAIQFWRPNYPHFGGSEGSFLGYTRRLGEDIAYLTDHGMDGTDIDSIINHWSTHGLVYYVTAKLLWEPHADVDDLIDDYCHAAFGPGAEPMRKYYDLIEEVTDAYAASEIADERDRDEDPVIASFTPDVIARLEKYLNEADSKIARLGDETQFAKRIAFVRQGFDWSALTARLYRLAQQKKSVTTASEHSSIQEEAKPLMDKWYRMMVDFLWENPLAVNVYSVAYKGAFQYLSATFAWERPRLESEIDPYRYVVDTFEGPRELAWFGTVYNPRTVEQSEGWTYETDRPEDFFGDTSRKVRKSNTTEFLIWESPRADEFQLLLYSKEMDVDHIVSVFGSADLSNWHAVPYDVRRIETSPAGWHKLLLTGELPEETTAFTQVVLKQSIEPVHIQLGSMTLRLVSIPLDTN